MAIYGHACGVYKTCAGQSHYIRTYTSGIDAYTPHCHTLEQEKLRVGSEGNHSLLVLIIISIPNINLTISISIYIHTPNIKKANINFSSTSAYLDNREFPFRIYVTGLTMTSTNTSSNLHLVIDEYGQF